MPYLNYSYILNVIVLNYYYCHYYLGMDLFVYTVLYIKDVQVYCSKTSQRRKGRRGSVFKTRFKVRLRMHS